MERSNNMASYCTLILGRRQSHIERMAIAYQRQGKLAEAERCVRQILTLDPTSFSAHSELPQILQAEGKTDDALAECVQLP